MNIKDYIDKKKTGLAEIVAASGGHAFATKVFSADDGSALMPIIEAVDAETLAERRDELIAEAADYDAVIADITAIPKEILK